MENITRQIGSTRVNTSQQTRDIFYVLIFMFPYRCQEVLLDNMLLGDNIARNAALRENVFMMTICVELKIPLFLVGKPGSSKSLAKSIVTESLKGKHSKKDLLKNFKEVSKNIMWQSQVENEHYSTLSELIRLVISLECFIEITPDFLCPFMND